MQQATTSPTFASDDDDFDGYAGSKTKTEKSLVRRQDIRLIPLCAIVYLLCFLDRANIGRSHVFKSSFRLVFAFRDRQSIVLKCTRKCADT